MQVVLNKQEKEKLVIRLHREGKTFREIAHIGHLSFTDIGKIIRKINGQKDEDIDLKNKSKDTKKVRFPPDNASMTYEEDDYQKLTYIMSPCFLE
jgi:hypothetical protein